MEPLQTTKAPPTVIDFETWKQTVNTEYFIICVTGDHGGETVQAAVDRKASDITKIGYTMWYSGSINAKPPIVQQFCKEATSAGKTVYLLLLDGGKSARPTTMSDTATHYSSTKENPNWTEIHKDMTACSGKMDHSTAAAFILNELLPAKGTLNLWDYARYSSDNTVSPVKWTLGGSTMCCITKDTSNLPDKMKSNKRKVIFIGKLADPFAVWIKGPVDPSSKKRKQSPEKSKEKKTTTKDKKKKKNKEETTTTQSKLLE